MSGNEMVTLYVLRCPLLRRSGLDALLDIERKTLNIPRIKRVIRPWSHGEQLLVMVALSLWNSEGKINLYELACTLSSNNMRVVVTALRIASGEYWPTTEELGYVATAVAS